MLSNQFKYNLLYVEQGDDGPVYYRSLDLEQLKVDRLPFASLGGWSTVDVTPDRLKLFKTAIARQNDPNHKCHWTRATQGTTACKTCGVVES